ncbi:MAG: TetR/AcrR family transcriptional regulator [Vicinamibacterales bacterium]
MARPPNSDGQRTRQAILDAALELFADKGYFGTRLRDVAGAVGVRESALYNYFPSKEALFEALLTADSASKTGQMAALLDAPIGDGRALLERLAGDALARFVEPHQCRLFRILMSDGIRLARDGRINLLEKMGSGRKALQALMQRLIAAGVLRDQDVEVLVAQFFGPLLMWRQMHTVDALAPGLRDRDAFVRAHVENFLNGAAALAVPVPVSVRSTASS